MKKQLTFYFIRHGRTVWNEQGLMQGHGDSPLTEQGVSGAQKTGVALKQVPFVAAYSSLLPRTIATAHHIESLPDKASMRCYFAISNHAYR